MDYGEATPASGRQAPVGFRPGADVDPPSVAPRRNVSGSTDLLARR